MRPLLKLFVLAVAILLALPTGGGAQEAEPPIAYEGWFFRAKPPSPQVETPAGPVSPGPGVPPAPQAPDGSYVVSSAGGQPGDTDTGGDTGWAAYQWDVFEAAGGTIEKFVVTLTQDPGNRGDSPNAPEAPIQACNVVAAWAAAPAANPWDERPTSDCAGAVVPTVEERDGHLRFTFDLTQMAQTWVDGTGHGVVIRPGGPEAEPPLPPFQVTFAGYNTSAENAEEVRPRVQFAYSGGASDLGGDLGGDFGGDLGGGFDDGAGGGSFDVGGDAPLDVFPDDVGSAPMPDPVAAPEETAAPPPSGAGQPTQPVASTSPGFPAAGWLLIPLAIVAFAATGTALGPAGEMALPRQGGVSRVLAERRAARRAGVLPPNPQETA